MIKQRGLNGFAKFTVSKPTVKPVVNTPVKKQPITYKIQMGDTLSEIARDNNTTVSRLCEINGITNPDKIYAEQTIIID